MTHLELVRSKLPAGGRVWVEELLVRGGPDGLRGAALTIGWDAPGIGASRPGGTVGPLPIAAAATADPDFVAAASMLNQQAIDGLAKATARVAALEAELAALRAAAGPA